MNYGMAVSNQDWRTDQRYRNVKEALLSTGHKVRVITTAMGWPVFVGVDDVICRANIEEYVEKVGLGVGPSTEPPAEPPPPVTEPEPEPEAAEPVPSEEVQTDTSPAAGEQVDAGDPPAEPIAKAEEATPLLASASAVFFANEHGIALADVPHKGAKITLPNVKTFLAKRDAADARDPD